MIVIKLRGGLGNQLFQYAFGLRISLERNVKLFIDVSDYSNSNIVQSKKRETIRSLDIQCFNISSKVFIKNKLNYCQMIILYINKISIKLNNYLFNNYFINYNYKIINSSANYFEGYFQSEKFFKKFYEQIYYEFKLNDSCKLMIQKYIDFISNDFHSVCVHVRRGDYINNSNFNICNEYYFERAIKYFLDRDSNSKFYIFSDDIDWCKKQIFFPKNTTFMNNQNENSAAQDLFLMSICKSNIISNSTLSWWGAYLNSNTNKIVIAPNRWSKDNTIKSSDIIPDGWILLDVE